MSDYFKQHKQEILDDFFTFLRFETVSAEEGNQEAFSGCLAWLEEYLRSCGLTPQVLDTSLHPVVFAENCKAGKEAKTLLLYHHYDVQPVDPVELWDTPPFTPTLKGDNIYARGASDNKGQCLYTLAALKAIWEEKGAFPLNIKVLIEGDEETGSGGLKELLQTKQKLFQADYIALVDSGILGADRPAITLGTRGVLSFDIELKGPKSDLHSGMEGGVAKNPNLALVELLASCFTKEGKVAIEGFYDGIVPLTDSEKRQIDFSFDHDYYENLYGIAPVGGEKEFGPYERAWLRPTFEINGLKGGYGGSGCKTVIPKEALAKISCRLVPNQDPKHLVHCIQKHLEAHVPEGVTMKMHVHPGGGSGYRSEATSLLQTTLKEVMEETYQKKTPLILCGGSIPIVDELRKTLDASIVYAGLGLPEDQIHAPNEHFGVDRLHRGLLIIRRWIEKLGEHV